MTSNAVLWMYALAPDVEISPGPGGTFLRTATSQTWVAGADEIEALELLAGAGSTEDQICGRSRLNESDTISEARSAALLFRLDRLGLLVRGLSSRGRQLASCIPLRPPPEIPLKALPEGPFRLSPRALARAEGNMVSLEVPGSWARMTIHDRDLLPLLHDLATERSAAQLAAAAVGHSEEAILALLALMSSCGLLDRADLEGWSTHDQLFHTRTRRGYARARLGKADQGIRIADQPTPSTTSDGLRRLVLEPPDLPRLLADDPPYALVCKRRQSVRRQGSLPLTSDQLSEFLFRTLHEREGRRPYPSGGACYPLKAYLAVHCCRDVARGLYCYDPVLHELIAVGEPGPGFDKLLADAAGAANVEQPPQVLLVLAAQYGRTQPAYGDLCYSLILKEVGGVFQAAMMAAAAMGLGTCPLGCGDSLLFSRLVGVSPLTEISVGELIVGSLEQSA